MQTLAKLLVFLIEGYRYGLPLAVVERAVRMVEITPLPKAPDIVLGVVNLQGRVIAAIDLRKRFRLPQRQLALTDQMIVARTTRRSVALVADSLDGVLDYSEAQAVGAKDVIPGVEYVEGLVKLPDGLVLIHDLERFLSLDEEAALDRALGVP